MKKNLTYALLISSYLLNAQKINYKIDAELVGINILGLGFSGEYLLKDSSSIGLRISGGYLPKRSEYENFIISSSINLIYNPAKLVNGKFHFRLGNTLYFQQQQNISIVGLSINEYDYWVEHYGINLGVHYNLLKKISSLELKLGVDAFVLPDNIDFKRGLYPIIPIPSVQIGLKL